MSISIIITTFNSSNNIENCLNSIYFEKDVEFEVIIVDNYSSDNTLDLSSKYTKNIFKQGPERSAQRNFGVKRSQYENILFLDSDMILSPFFLKQLSNYIKSFNPQALYISEKIIINNFFSKLRDHERYFYTGTPIDCVRFFKKSLFNQVGGFDEKFSGPEDWDFNNKILEIYSPKILTSDKNFKTATLNDIVLKFYKKNNINLKKYSEPCFYHDEREIGFINHIKKKIYYSKSLSKYIDKWGPNNKYVKKQLGAYYRFFFVFFENGKYKKFLKKVYLSLPMLVYKSLIYVVYLLKKWNLKI